MQNVPPLFDDNAFEDFLTFLAKHFHYDFSGYARASLQRRVARARDALRCATLADIQEKLVAQPGLATKFMDMLTVQVSEMFRDPAYFLALREKVIPYLSTYPSLKIWVSGCSAGEEFYSLAILLKEEGLLERCIFYATDISSWALRQARAGTYALDRLPLFEENYRQAGGKAQLADYYSVGHERIHFHESLRKNTVFADHNLAIDQVFSEVHLVSCRNVLIYFDKLLQRRAIQLFHDALVDNGFLGLGAKEMIEHHHTEKNFIDFDLPHRIYQKNPSF